MVSSESTDEYGGEDQRKQRQSRNNLVVQDNRIIESKYKLGLVSKKLILLYISRVDNKGEFWGEQEFSIDEIQQVLHWKHKQSLYKELYRSTKDMISSPISIRDGNYRRFKIYSWFSKVEFDGTTLKLSIHDDLKNFFIDLKRRFTAYEIENIMELGSVISVRIYELLKQYERIGERKFDIDELKSILGIEDKYRRSFTDFRRFVIERAQKDLAEHTDLYFEYITEKSGRKITSILFRIYSKQSQAGGLHNTSHTPKDYDSRTELNELFKDVDAKLGQSFARQFFYQGMSAGVPETLLLQILDQMSQSSSGINNPWAYGKSIIANQMPNVNETEHQEASVEEGQGFREFMESEDGLKLKKMLGRIGAGEGEE